MWAGDGAVVPSNLIQALVVLKFILSQSPPEFLFLYLFHVALFGFLDLKHESDNSIFYVFRFF